MEGSLLLLLPFQYEAINHNLLEAQNSNMERESQPSWGYDEDARELPQGLMLP